MAPQRRKPLQRRKSVKATPESSDNSNNAPDRLSALSDCLLHLILSRLDPKEAAATAVLSTRWKDVFLSIPEVTLHFPPNDDVWARDRLFSIFVPFAGRILRHRNHAPIKKIRLSVNQSLESFQPGFEFILHSIAKAVATNRVENLSIFMDLDKTTEPFYFPMPREVFCSETLVGLHLSIRVGWNVPGRVWLPNLKNLHLVSFKLGDGESVPRLLRGCPSLENLVLILQELDVDEILEGNEVAALSLCSPSLQCVMLYWEEEVEWDFNLVVKGESLESLFCSLQGRYKITVDAPNLTTLTMVGHVLEVDIVQSLVSIDDAVLKAGFLFDVEDVDDLILRAGHAFTFFSGLQHVRTLTLSENIMKALYFSPPAMPTFRNLVNLKLTPVYCRFFPRNWILQVLFKLFESSPNVELLSISELSDNYFGEDADFDSVFTRAFPLSSVEHLKVLEMIDFKGGEHEFKLVEYLLKNGKSLEMVALERDGWNSVPNDCQRILSFEKCSEHCQIVFKKKWDLMKCQELLQRMSLSP